MDKKLIALFNSAKEKLGKTEIPEALKNLVDTTKKKLFIKKIRKEMSVFYNEEHYNGILSMLEADQKVLNEVSLQAPVVAGSALSALQSKYSKPVTVASIDYAKKLSELQFFNLYKEIKCQEEAYKHFPAIFENAVELEKYNQVVTAVNTLQPLVESVYKKRNLIAIYNKDFAEVADFVASYTQVVDLLK